ncbi:replication-relaxation family protein [Kitasatospora sp. NPDC058048]|uniref:replication-relaxation family protein n=1 Tax=Kitasatospora sp. NPDC058048 TaxID=3346313 RepID=UPI0036D8D396
MDDHDDQDEQQPGGPSRPGRVHFRRSARNPNGSTAPLRADVLAALGVLKIATYKQLHALIAADEYRAHHRVEHVAEAVRDLEKHKLVDVRGATSPPGRRPAPKTAPASADGDAKPKPGGPGAEKIVGLTPLGLAAAAEALGDDRDMGGHARGAGLTGAPHAMLVNELIITAVTGTTTHGAPPRTDNRQAPPRRALPTGPLPGGIEAWATETPHTITGKFNVIPDAVVRLPEIGIPVLFLELDRGTMTDIRKVAGKLDNYKRYFDRTVQDGGQERLEVEVRYNAPEPEYGYSHRRTVRPPVLFVLDQGTRGSRPRYSPEALEQRLKGLRDATSEHWQGWAGEQEGVTYATFHGKIPVLGTTVERLREHGWQGPTWWRFGRPGWHSLTDALNDEPDWDLIDQRRQEREGQEKAEERRAKKAEQDAADARYRAQLLAARAHNDRLHPCYTCQGPLGGAHDSGHELVENAEPDRLECPACLADRRARNGRPIVLDLPSPRDLKKAGKNGPPASDPWWTVRLIHAQRWPKAKRDSGNVPELWSNARA